jgi:hypothetical protein
VDKNCTKTAYGYKCCCVNGSLNLQIASGDIVRQGIISGIKRKDYVGGRISYIILRGCWCDIFVLNAHRPLKKKGRNKIEFY